MRKFTGYRLQVTGFIALFLTVLLYPTPYTLTPILAQVPCGSSGPTKAEGLVTAPQISNSFVTTGNCIINPKTAFAPFRIPTFEDLKSLYYDQKPPAQKEVVKSSSLDNLADNKFYFRNGDLSVTAPIGGNGTAVVFVTGNLTIGPIAGNRLTYGTPSTGLVFIVKGDVNIYQSVIQINAVIIAEGIICTAYDGTNCPAAYVQLSQLIINGSLISLDEAKPIKFRRTLGFDQPLNNNNAPAEQINQEVKYLVILRHLLSDTLQRWSEVP